MSNNIILKFFLDILSKNNDLEQYNNRLEKPIKDLSIFQLLNIVGKNRLFICGLILFIFFGFFLRANISIGVFFGFLFLLLIFSIYFKYLVFNIEEFTKDKQEKILFLNTILDNSNQTMRDSLLSSNENWIQLGIKNKSYLYLNPVVVDFYYKNKYMLEFSYNNFCSVIATY